MTPDQIRARMHLTVDDAIGNSSGRPLDLLWAEASTLALVLIAEGLQPREPVRVTVNYSPEIKALVALMETTIRHRREADGIWEGGPASEESLLERFPGSHIAKCIEAVRPFRRHGEPICPDIIAGPDCDPATVEPPPF